MSPPPLMIVISLYGSNLVSIFIPLMFVAVIQKLLEFFLTAKGLIFRFVGSVFIYTMLFFPPFYFFIVFFSF